MEKKTLVGVNGNAYCVIGTVSGWMKEAYKNASIPDEDGQVDEVAMKLFDSDAIKAYTKNATSSDYNHLLCVSCEMVSMSQVASITFSNASALVNWCPVFVHAPLI